MSTDKQLVDELARVNKRLEKLLPIWLSRELKIRWHNKRLAKIQCHTLTELNDELRLTISLIDKNDILYDPKANVERRIGKAWGLLSAMIPVSKALSGLYGEGHPGAEQNRLALYESHGLIIDTEKKLRDQA